METRSDSQLENSKRVESPFSRENTVSCPQFMALLGYIGKAYGVPKFGWARRALLYHYTDATGLLGIISSNRLWATDASFLNDPSEGLLFPERIIDFMRQKLGGLTSQEEQIIAQIEEGLRKQPKPLNAFTISFCDDGDLLSQWRGYGLYGSGYAIGFDPENIALVQLGHLVEVRYDFKGVRELALDLLSIFVEAASKWHTMLLDRFCDEAALAIRYLSLGFKSAGYGEERETRILTRPNDKAGHPFEVMAPLKFRVRGADIVPYVNLAPNVIPGNDGSPPRLPKSDEHPPRLPIRRIVTGPGVDYLRNKSSLERLLVAHGYDSVEIVQSLIPFRS
jgi:hypothetical protein